MESTEFSSFEEAKRDYSYKLSQTLDKYDLTLPEYLKKIKEKDINKIINPKDEKELTIAVKCLEIIGSSYEYADSRNLKVRENLSGTFYYLLIKGLEDKRYFDVAQDYMNNVFADPILYGNFIVDSILFDVDDMQSDMLRSGAIFDQGSAIKAFIKLAYRAASILIKAVAKESKKKGSYLEEFTKKSKGKKGAEKYAASHDLVFGYLNSFNDQQNIGETFAMTYRNKYRL